MGVAVDAPDGVAPEERPATEPTPAGTAPITFDVNAGAQQLADVLAKAIAGAAGGKDSDGKRLVDAFADLFGVGPAAQAARAEAERRAKEAAQMRLIALGALGALAILLVVKLRG